MKTTNLKTKVMSILLAIVMLLGMLPMSVFAADTTLSYVALGDSISTGYGLADKTKQGFTYMLANSLGYELTNLAVDGNTAAGILAQLEDPEDTSAKTAVAAADLITITAGGNDLMALLYQAIADQYNATQTDEANKISASDVTKIMADSSDGRRMTILNYAMGLLNPASDIYLIDDQVFTDAVTAYIDTLNQVMSTIKNLNADATVIVATQYNPYVEYNGASVTFFMPIDLTPIYQGMENGVTALNTAIKNNAATGGYTVADVKEAFDSAYSATNDLYVADPTTLEFDFHPNAAGHYVVANTVAYACNPTGYSITFDANGGTGYMATVYASDIYIYPECGFTAPEGYRFAGWSRYANSSVINASGHTIIPSSNITLYARWELIPTLPTPTNLRWNGKVAEWDAVEGAAGYTVEFEYSTGSGGGGNTGYYYTNYIDYSYAPDYLWRFRVKAQANNGNAVSEWSEWSDVIAALEQGQLTAPILPDWQGFWPNWRVASEFDSTKHKFVATLYKEGVTDAITVIEGMPPHDINELIREKGSGTYYFTVKTVSLDTTAESKTVTSPKKAIDVDTIPQLAAPTNLRWNKTKAEWDAVNGATKYYFELFRNGSRVMRGDGSNTYEECDFLFDEDDFGAGVYTFRVTALAQENGVTLAQAVSAMSGEYIVLDTPKNLVWDGTVARWGSVENATGYLVYLDRPGELSTLVFDTNDTQKDMKEYFTEAGEYIFYVYAYTSTTGSKIIGWRSDDSAAYPYDPNGFTVTIINGTGSGKYTVGDAVTIKPNEPASGYRFGWWDGMDGLFFYSTNGTTGECVLRMPARDVTMTAYYERIPTEQYTMTVVNGKLDAYGGATQAQILEQTMFSFTANEPEAGYQFKEWTWTGVESLSFANLTTKNSKTAFISMPSANVTVTAVYEKLPAEAPTVTESDDLTLTYKDYTDKQISVIVTDPKEGYTYSYQWYDASTDQPISGATNAAYTVPNDLAAGSYSYYCVVAAKRDDNGETSSSQSFDIAVTVNKATLTADDFNFKGPDILVFHPANFKNATVTAKDGVTGVGEITVQYFDEQGQPHSYAVDAGTYTVKINVTEGDNYLAADGLTADGWVFTITKGTQDAPSSPVGVAETVYGKNDGKITGVNYEMEYRKASETDADYKTITDAEITGLAADTYYVRLKETDNLLASAPATVTIAAGRMLTVTVPTAAEQIGYTIEAPTSCAYGATVEIKITALEGYGRDENFDVYNNGNLVSNKYSSATGILTLENVTEDINITLANGSFVDRTKPTAEITLGTNKWNTFWNNLTFDLFFKETQTVTITADDKGSGLDKVYYYISKSEMERSDVISITEWQEYTGAFNIDPDRVAVIYVKVVDKAGNLWLVNSDGLVLDATAPTLEGIENGKTYYGDLTVILPADQFGDIDQVTLDGETMTFAEGTYGRIPADNQEHTVVVTDKAGNKTEYKITVNKVYEITFKHPTFELGFPVNYDVSFNQAHPDTVQDMAASKDYHTFIGWYESTDGGATLKDTPYDFDAKVTENVTLYPLFEIYTYTVTYKADGEVVGTVTVEHGTDATAPTIPEKEGYTQTAPVWDKDGKNIIADTEISAVYTINEYTITFMDENGVYKTVTVKHGEKLEMPEAPKKDGYTVKWETTIDKATGNATVKAVYTEIPATDKPSSPQTGDNSNMALWFALLLLSGGAVITLTVYDRKRRSAIEH